NIIECQLIESALLNIINFESLIATKAFRIKMVCGDRKFSDFGLRRAQGLGAINATRAAAIGGASSTSNVFSGKLYDIPPSGTQAHSWIQSFDNELEAFRAYAFTNPENSILLVDTYNTLRSGVPNAIRVAQEMEKEGHRLKAIRLDSGDLAYLSKKARKMLDDEGLEYVNIVASNQLNEHVIKSLLHEQNASIDFFGVGTELITGKDNAALDGVYKLAEVNGKGKMKFSENLEKVTLPGKKKVYRYFDQDGMFFRDGILLEKEDENRAEIIHHPIYPERSTTVAGLKKEALLQKVVDEGEIFKSSLNTADINAYLMKRSSQLPEEHKRFISPHIYKVGISTELLNLRETLAKSLKQKIL
ncbi:MAG TPA: nicotinate phosphoribosyltransferase, partial [Mariniphaga sp.]|nr:nicotinate phosphoribosyltransferase [Mariniphaga sp.]